MLMNTIDLLIFLEGKNTQDRVAVFEIMAQNFPEMMTSKYRLGNIVKPNKNFKKDIHTHLLSSETLKSKIRP